MRSIIFQELALMKTIVGDIHVYFLPKKVYMEQVNAKYNPPKKYITKSGFGKMQFH